MTNLYLKNNWISVFHWVIFDKSLEVYSSMLFIWSKAFLEFFLGSNESQ